MYTLQVECILCQRQGGHFEGPVLFALPTRDLLHRIFHCRCHQLTWTDDVLNLRVFAKIRIFTAIHAVAVHAHEQMCMGGLGMQPCLGIRRTGYAGPIKEIECHSAIVQLRRKCRKLSFAV